MGRQGGAHRAAGYPGVTGTTKRLLDHWRDEERSARFFFCQLVRRFRPDFLVRLANGATLVLEVKGKDTPQDRAKRASLEEWIAAVNEHGGFGRWSWAVSFSPSDLKAILTKQLAQLGDVR